MKKKLFGIASLLLGSLFCQAQEPVINFSGELYFIPGSMTKSGEAYLMSKEESSNDYQFTIYDGDFNVVKTFKDPTAGIPYQERVVTKTLIYYLDNWGGYTRAAVGDWTVAEDQTYDRTTEPSICSFEMYSDNNDYHSRYIYVTQTLFNDDEDFEYIRRTREIVPIDVKYEDFAKQHSSGYTGPTDDVSYGNDAINAIMKETGASNYELHYDETGKPYLKLYKYETYGGLFYGGVEIASLDGTLKTQFPHVNSIYSAYLFRGKCYVQGYGADNTRVLYRLDSKTTNVKEVMRESLPLSVQRVGDNLVVESSDNANYTIVLSNMAGQVLRSTKASKGKTQIPLHGLISGVYIVTLFDRSAPLESKKILIK